MQHAPHDGHHGHDCGHETGHSVSHGRAGHQEAGHHHAHAPKDYGWAFALGAALNLGFVGVEATAGILANSTALLADAGHNLGDVLGLVIAWAANEAQKRAPTERFTYGLRASPVVASLINATLLLIAVGAIAVEAIRHLVAPEPVASMTIVAVALAGLVINGLTALMFMGNDRADLNARGAYLHMAADAAVSLGVVVAGLLIMATGAAWIDPMVSLLIAAIIVWGAWGLLRDSVRMALHAVPARIDPQAVRRSLEALPGVASVHDLHIWPIGTHETALTCHLVMPAGCPGDGFIADAAEGLADTFGIGHATLQIEQGDAAPCKLAPASVI